MGEKYQIDLLEIRKAIYYAKKYHGTQKRQSGEPFYSHPLEVAFLFAEYVMMESKEYFRTDLLVSAILHDTIEDTELTEAMIAAAFGQTVARQVEGLTRVKAHGKITSEELVESLIAHGDRDILMIKLCDRLHNLQTIKHKSPNKIKKILHETIRAFLLLSVYLEMPQIKNILIRLCYEHLDIKQNFLLLGLPSVLSDCSCQIPPLSFQSGAGQTNTQ